MIASARTTGASHHRLPRPAPFTPGGQDLGRTAAFQGSSIPGTIIASPHTRDPQTTLSSASTRFLETDTNKFLQATRRVLVMPRRVPVCSRRAARSATPSRRTAATRSAPPCTASSDARLAPSRATPTPTPTSRRASSGTTTPCSPTSRTPRSTSPVPRWLSVA